MTAVIWHDLECGAYRRDLPLWLGLAAVHGEPVLDVGAGTGRVTLELARAGHGVLALDRDQLLLSELERRAGSLPIRTACADARDFSLGERFPLCVVPMQTIQLLEVEPGRLSFLGCARQHLTPDGVLAIAIADRLEPFEVHDGDSAPLPDIEEISGVVYCSQPTAVRSRGDQFVLERRRETVDPAGRRQVSHDAIALDRVTVRSLVAEAARAGLRRVRVTEIPPTPDHVGSEVVVLAA